MIAAKISAYLCLEQLPEMKTVTRKSITAPRKQPRFDLVSMYGHWEALEKLGNYKGLLFMNLIPTGKNEHRKQDGTTPEYYLQCTPAKSKAINFSGIRFLYTDGKETTFASGEPSDRDKLKGGIDNPMYNQRNDGFLFLFSQNMERLEILIIDGARNLIDAYRKQLSCGGFDEVLNDMRRNATPFM